MSALQLPWIGLVTPSFNQAEFLPQTLDSVLDQAYPHLLYHVQDGGSTDGSVAILERYGPRLSSWNSSTDSGQYAGINRGFDRLLADPRPEVLGWLNSDDLLLPGALHSVGEIFAFFPEVTWITSLVRLSCDHSGRIDDSTTLPGLSATAFRERRYLPTGSPSSVYNFIQQESSFWRRSLWTSAGAELRTDCGMAADYALWQRFFQLSTGAGAGVSVPLALNRRQHRQQSTAIATYVNQAMVACHPKAPSSIGYRLRSLLMRLGFHHWPAVARRLAPHLGYEGLQIVRLNPQSPGNSWGLIRHRFL